VSSSARVSPTAHYTGYVWVRNGLSPSELATPEGRALYESLRDGGPGSIAELTGQLDHSTGLAIVTEGLLGYLESEAVLGLWQRFASVLATFPTGRYLSDLHLGGLQTPTVRAFRLLLSAFVRGRVHLHFESAEEACRALREAGFASAEVRRAADVTREVRDPGSRLAHIIEASTT
jgi:O-methyltransferase involved in polyketide biosynthesis